MGRVCMRVFVVGVLNLFALPGGSAAQDYQGLVAEALRRGFEGNEGLSRQIRPGPVWLDTTYANQFLRTMGVRASVDVERLPQVYGETPIRLVGSFDEILIRGAGDDARLVALVRQSELANGITIRRPAPDRMRNPTSWIREGGVYATIREFSETDPTRDNLGLQKSPDPSVVRFEVIHRFTGWYYMPVGTGIVYEAKWMGARWQIRELARKVS